MPRRFEGGPRPPEQGAGADPGPPREQAGVPSPSTLFLEHPSEGFSDLVLNSFRAGEIIPSTTGGRRGKMNLPALNSFSRLRYSDSQQTAWIPESSEDGSSGPQGWGWEEKGECQEPA